MLQPRPSFRCGAPWCRMAELLAIRSTDTSALGGLEGGVKGMDAATLARHAPGAHFMLLELGKRLPVEYAGVEPPPDTFKDNAQALARFQPGRHGQAAQIGCAFNA